MLSAVRDRAVEAEVELELPGGVLVVAVAHVEAQPLAVVDDVEQHRTELLEHVDVVAVGLGHALGVPLLVPLHPHHLGLDPDHEAEPELLLELRDDALQVLARVGVEQLSGLGVVAVAENTSDALVPREHLEGVEVGDRRQLRLLGAEADVVALEVGEQVRGGAVDELVALLGDLGEERGDDALAHHPPGDRDLLEEDVLDLLVLDPLHDLLNLVGAPLLVACLLEGGRGHHGLRGLQDRLDGPPHLLGRHARAPFRPGPSRALLSSGGSRPPPRRELYANEQFCTNAADGAPLRSTQAARPSQFSNRRRAAGCSSSARASTSSRNSAPFSSPRVAASESR